MINALQIDPALAPGALEAMEAELKLRLAKKAQARPGGLIEFVRYFWSVIEPETKLVEGWVLEAICEHLEAVTLGKITRLLINVPPGSMKSLMVNVFWPAWEWGAMGQPSLRYVSFSYSSGLTERDNTKFRKLVTSERYRGLWGDNFELEKEGEIKITNNKTGSKFASSVKGIGTGERGDRVVIDDPHDVHKSESEVVRSDTLRWFRETITDRLNNLDDSAIIIIMQRVHQLDISGFILEQGWPYCHLMVPMEFESGRQPFNPLGWVDPRTEEGDLAWPDRFSPEAVASIEREKGSYAYCTPYEAPVLMADLSMRPIGEVQAGDRIVGFSTETNGRKRRLIEAEVLSVSKSFQRTWRLTLNGQDSIRCTRDHKWYTRRSDASHALYKSARSGSKLMRVCPASLPVLKAEQIRAAGWLSGFFDGEGSAVRVKRSHGHPDNSSCLISFTQGAEQNLPLCEELERNLALLGFSFGCLERPAKAKNESDKRWYYLTGDRLPIYQRFLHLVQPHKWRERIRCGAFGPNFVVSEEEVTDIDQDHWEMVYGLETTTGNYVVWGLASSNSGQYQQRPAPRGGGIIKREHWRAYTPEECPKFGVPWPKLPVMSYTIMSLDTAQTEKKQNDPSAAVIVGVCRDMYETRKIILMWAWAERMELYELTRKIEETCKKFKVDRVLIEDTASGHPVAQELRRRGRTISDVMSYNPKTKDRADFGVQLMNPREMGGDKVARAYSVQNLFECGLIYAPAESTGNGDFLFKDWADRVMTQLAELPKGAQDDLADAMTQALIYLRKIGLAQMPDEDELEARDEAVYRSAPTSLYPAVG